MRGKGGQLRYPCEAPSRCQPLAPLPNVAPRELPPRSSDVSFAIDVRHDVIPSEHKRSHRPVSRALSVADGTRVSKGGRHSAAAAAPGKSAGSAGLPSGHPSPGVATVSTWTRFVHHFVAERSCICFGGASLTSRMSDHGDDQCRSIAHRVANLTEGCVSAGFQPFDCKMSGMCANFVPNPWQWARSPIIRFRNPSPESEPPTHTAAPATEGLPVHLSTPSWPPPIADWQARCSALSASEFAHP